MKTLIATALVLSAGLAQAASFDHEKQIGTPELFTTLATEGAVSVNVDADRNFAYQVAVDTPNLFPTLESAGNPSVTGERTVFEYQQNIGTQELDPSLS
ncbi:MAG: hypothetical protein QNJ91_03315 [Gammaproteobacteria bacterium]|nr:hypothetical protein [Gammaproteobacteria bacterium]